MGGDLLQRLRVGVLLLLQLQWHEIRCHHHTNAVRISPAAAAPSKPFDRSDRPPPEKNRYQDAVTFYKRCYLYKLNCGGHEPQRVDAQSLQGEQRFNNKNRDNPESSY